MKTLIRIAIGFDQFCNTLIGGYPDETFSARCWRFKDDWKYKYIRVFVDRIFGIDHCKKSFESEILRTQSPKEEK